MSTEQNLEQNPQQEGPRVVLFDVNETLSDLSPLAARFVAVGQPASACSLWFASVLRDAFALSTAGECPSFSEVARQTMLHQFSRTELHKPLEESVDHVLAGLDELPVHADVVSGVTRLHDAGHRLVTLSNGSAAIAERLLADAGVRDRFEHVLSVDDAGAWKPDGRAYGYAAQVCGVEPGEVVLVAVHPWDVDGAARAGLRTAWVDRSEAHYPTTFTRPDHTVADLDELAEVLGEAPAAG